MLGRFGLLIDFGLSELLLQCLASITVILGIFSVRTRSLLERGLLGDLARDESHLPLFRSRSLHAGFGDLSLELGLQLDDLNLSRGSGAVGRGGKGLVPGGHGGELLRGDRRDSREWRGWCHTTLVDSSIQLVGTGAKLSDVGAGRGAGARV